MAKSAGRGPVRLATVDITLYPQLIFDRQQRRALNTY